SLLLLGGRSVAQLRIHSLDSYIATPPANVERPLALSSAYRVYMKTAQINMDSPANRFVFVDVNPGNICTPGFGVDMALQTIIHYPSTLHLGSGILTFADNHIETHKWRDPRTNRKLPGPAQYIPHTDPVANDQDIKWIAERTTSKK